MNLLYPHPQTFGQRFINNLTAFAALEILSWIIKLFIGKFDWVDLPLGTVLTLVLAVVFAVIEGLAARLDKPGRK